MCATMEFAVDQQILARLLCRSATGRHCWVSSWRIAQKGWRQSHARHRRSIRRFDDEIVSQCLSSGLGCCLQDGCDSLLSLRWPECSNGHQLERADIKGYLCTCSICQQRVLGDCTWDCGACDLRICASCCLIGSLKFLHSSPDNPASGLGESCRLQSSAERVAVVVRIHSGTTTAMMERHIGWATSLSASPEGSAMKVWVLVDETFGVNTVRQKLQALALEAGLTDSNWGVVPYTEADMEVIFCTMRSLRAAIPRRKDVEDCFTLPHKKSLAWGFHVEAILIWWVLVGRSASRPSYTWVIEDDAGYSGSVLGFLKTYASEACPSGHCLQRFQTLENDYTCSRCDGSFPKLTWMLSCRACDFDVCKECQRGELSADLLAYGLQCVSTNWIWKDVVTPAFSKVCPDNARLRCSEHLQRFSARFLDKLLHYCWEGISGWSEMSVPTLCYKAGFDLAPLQDRHIGQIFQHDGKVPREHWEAICATAFTRDRWWHALKW